MSHVSMGMLSLSLASLALLMPYAYAVSVGGQNHVVPPRSLIIGGVEVRVIRGLCALMKNIHFPQPQPLASRSIIPGTRG